MPTYRGITTELHSQFDVDTLPEYFPHSPCYYARHGITGHIPPAIDDLTSTCSVYIPVYPGSQFWLSYSVSQPVPENQMYLFKLFINNNHIVSWSSGRDEGWRGKTMFGLFERARVGRKRAVEKRVLCFAPSSGNGAWAGVENALDEDRYLEIRVHRACGRKRVARKGRMQSCAELERAQNEKGIELANAGRAGHEHPKRLYQFALIDPVDQPFASFRYYYRTWDQIQYLRLLDDSESSSNALPEPDKPGLGQTHVRGGNIEDVFANVSLSDDERAPTPPPHAYIRRDEHGQAERSRSEQGQRNSRVLTPPRFYRLSVPPSLKLEPPNSAIRNLPLVPQKKDALSSTSYQPQPAYPVEEWIKRTPSPIKSIRDGISTPPLVKRRGFTATGLMNAVTSAWKRRVPSTERSNGTESRASSRNRDASWLK